MEKDLIKTTLCYLKKDDSYLLLYRNKKENDMNEGKWLGIGGHVEKGESIKKAAIREVYEETGLTINRINCVGEVLFVNDDYEEMMYVYKSEDFSGDIKECNEGSLKWIPIKDIYSLPMWEGDKAFLPLLEQKVPYFKFKIRYHQSELASIEKIN